MHSWTSLLLTLIKVGCFSARVFIFPTLDMPIANDYDNTSAVGRIVAVLIPKHQFPNVQWKNSVRFAFLMFAMRLLSGIQWFAGFVQGSAAFL